MKKYKFRIGMRTVKTALSVFICLLIYHILSVIQNSITTSGDVGIFLKKIFLGGSPTFACIATVICLQSTIGKSVEFAVSRIIGSVFGGLFGIAVNEINVRFFNSRADIFIAVLGVVGLISFCSLINHKEASSITVITFLIIVVGFDYSEPYVIAFNRIVGTIIGVIVSLSVNKLIKSPPE